MSGRDSSDGTFIGATATKHCSRAGVCECSTHDLVCILHPSLTPKERQEETGEEIES